MTSTSFESSLNNILQLLDKKAWATPLQELSEKFQLIPEDAFDFKAELLNLLHGLHEAIIKDPSLPLSQLAAIRISNLDCWTFRFLNQNNVQPYLDPLYDSISDFKVGSSLTVIQSNSAYPAPDMVKRWARAHLN